MNDISPDRSPITRAGLRSYYLIRAAIAGLWVAAAILVGTRSAAAGAILLVAYPAWDAAANMFDVRRSGGWRLNLSQTINVFASALAAIAIATVYPDMAGILAAFGIWAIVAGLLQLAAGVGRWGAFGAQWVMVLSGGQSALVGGLLLHRAFGDRVPTIMDVVPYASLGAFYFLLSALWLTFRKSR